MMMAQRFRELCLREGYAAEGYAEESIGIYMEKRLHRILKNTLCEDRECHEVKVGKCIADILEGNLITEIQTASTAPLLAKLGYYLENTELSIRVVIPLVAKRTIIRAERETGEILRVSTSPKKERDIDLLAKLFPIREMLSSDRVSVWGLSVTLEEYRYSERMRYRREGRYDSDVFPQEIVGETELYGTEDYKELLPSELFGTEFSAADFGRITRIRGIDRYSALNTLVALGIVECEKRGRANVYKIV